MVANKCNTCFYSKQDRYQFPCVGCEGYNKYVRADVFTPDTVQLSTWDDKDAFVNHGGGSTLDDYPEIKMDLNVNSPKHYTSGKYEVIDVIEDWDLNFRLANTIKYIARHKHKGKPLEDLKKALWYLEREIDKWNSLSKN